MKNTYKLLFALLLFLLALLISVDAPAQIPATIDNLVIGNTQVDLNTTYYQLTGSFNQENITLTTQNRYTPVLSSVTTTYYLASNPSVIVRNSYIGNPPQYQPITIISSPLQFTPTIADDLIVNVTLNYVSGLYETTSIIVRVNNTYQGNSLPVTLVSFKGVKKEELVTLTWITSSEVNTNHFEIQKSTDGVNWLFITSLQAQGRGQYSTKDNFDSRYIYYRLRIVDNDLSINYSPVVVVDDEGLFYEAYYDEIGRVVNSSTKGLVMHKLYYTSGRVETHKYYKP